MNIDKIKFLGKISYAVLIAFMATSSVYYISNTFMEGEHRAISSIMFGLTLIILVVRWCYYELTYPFWERLK